MELDSNVISYWRHSACLESLMQTTPEKIKDFWRTLSTQECNSGKVADCATIESLRLRGDTMVVAPKIFERRSQQGQQIFIPYYLLVNINCTGKLVAAAMHALPVIPKAVLESSTIRPSAPLVLGAADQFETYFAIHPPIWQESLNQLNWQAQLAYAEQVIEDITENAWKADLRELGYSILDEVKIFPLADLALSESLDVSILDNIGSVELISADRKSGKSEYAYRMVVDAWVESAVKKDKPPKYVHLEYNENLRYANIIKNQPLTSAEDINLVHSQLKFKFNLYYKGKQLLKNWQDVSNRLHTQYSEHSGIKARHKELLLSYEQARAETRLLEVLESIWHRQISLVPAWSAPLDFVPILQRRRLQRLYKFFAENFPKDNVKNENLKQMTEILLAKMQSAKSRLRTRQDALHQVENDMQQETMLKQKIAEWEKQHNYDMSSNKLWNEVVSIAQKYWLLYFNLNSEYADYFYKEPDSIDMLIVEHAEYISPMHAARILAKTKRALIMGTYDHISRLNFSTHLDYEITKEFGLVTCDSDFEDLQFEGVIGSVGNLWSLATMGREADQTFTKNQALGLEYTIIDIKGLSRRYLGSRVNFAEIETIVHWLQKNHKTSHKVAVYTTFCGQSQCLRDALDAAAITNVSVRLLQEPSFDIADIILFSPVYTEDDRGPYNFDRGSEMLENMIANTGRRLILVGDSSIFKPQLHSAAGKFARLFMQEEAVGV